MRRIFPAEAIRKSDHVGPFREALETTNTLESRNIHLNSTEKSESSVALARYYRNMKSQICSV